MIMTGMGKDGLEGLKKVKDKGGYIIAQNEETCVVYGMPKAVVDAGLADSILPLDKIGEVITNMGFKMISVFFQLLISLHHRKYLQPFQLQRLIRARYPLFYDLCSPRKEM